MTLTRRSFTLGGAAAMAATLLNPRLAHSIGVTYGNEVPFSFDAVIAWANLIAKLPYMPHVVQNRDLVTRIDYDAYQQIKYRASEAIWADGGAAYPVELFHVGKYFQEPARIFVVKDGKSREVLYTPELFTYGKADFARALPSNTGFAGFRVMYGKGQPDWLAFLGASYFRSSGETRQYGLSTRGLAIDTAMPWPEEFPRFTNFWLEPLPAGQDGIMIYAIMDSQSVTGAYKITATRGKGVITEVEAKLFARKDITRLGIAPLTSMYWYSKTNRRQSVDWRPEIHDSDGLAIWTGAGERIWRPLNNPFGVQTSSFFDKNPRGFGLSQRERRFDRYEDDGVFYEKRPSVWIEPMGEWGEGSVQLVEIPTHKETDDNIVAYWTPKEQLKAGGAYAMRYKIHWRLDEPYQAFIGSVFQTNVGAGGIPGHPILAGVTKYVVDFHGGMMGRLENTDGVKLVVTAPRGLIERKAAYRVVGTDRWRAMFDYTPADRTPVDLRMFLEKDGNALTETWLYQHLAG